MPSRHLLRTEEQLAGIRESARINTALLDYISENIREGMSTAEIDHMVYCFTTDHDAIPAPFLYEGFPKSVCVSINDVVCHGIPSTKEFLRSGDIVNVDVSTIYKGYFSDASRMYMIGEVSPEMQRLVQVTRECRDIGIQALQLIPVARDGDLPVAVVIDRPDMVIGCTALGTVGRCGCRHPGACREERLQRGARPLRAWRGYQVSRRAGRGALRQTRHGHADSTGHDVHHRADD